MAGAVGSADVARLAEALRRSGQQSEATTQSVLVESANYLLTEMEIRVPVDTGELRESLGVRVEGNRVLVGPAAPYAQYVEYGTKPHEIRPKNKKALSFVAGGKRVTVRSVHHPGTRAQPFVRPAFQAWVDSLGPMVASANINVLKREAGNA